MITILGKNYMTDKEASKRYGYSRAWFILKRHQRQGPPFVRLNGKGKTLYAVDETDLWFKQHLQEQI